VFFKFHHFDIKAALKSHLELFYTVNESAVMSFSEIWGLTLMNILHIYTGMEWQVQCELSNTLTLWIVGLTADLETVESIEMFINAQLYANAKQKTSGGSQSL